jgi:hypothetical protein
MHPAEHDPDGRRDDECKGADYSDQQLIAVDRLTRLIPWPLNMRPGTWLR